MKALKRCTLRISCLAPNIKMKDHKTLTCEVRWVMLVANLTGRGTASISVWNGAPALYRGVPMSNAYGYIDTGVIPKFACCGLRKL